MQWNYIQAPNQYIKVLQLNNRIKAFDMYMTAELLLLKTFKYVT